MVTTLNRASANGGRETVRTRVGVSIGDSADNNYDLDAVVDNAGNGVGWLMPPT